MEHHPHARHMGKAGNMAANMTGVAPGPGGVSLRGEDTGEGGQTPRRGLPQEATLQGHRTRMRGVSMEAETVQGMADGQTRPGTPLRVDGPERLSQELVTGCGG